jgi:hypothetical protein
MNGETLTYYMDLDMLDAGGLERVPSRYDVMPGSTPRKTISDFLLTNPRPRLPIQREIRILS